MLNKIQIIGKLILSLKQKETDFAEIAIDDFSQNPDVEYYNVMVKVPNGSVTLIRCMIKQQEKIDKWKQEIKNNDLVEIRGFLRNETNGRQILVRVTNWKKIEGIAFEELEDEKCNFVRLIGKITDLKNPEENNQTESYNSNIVSFKVACSSQSNRSLFLNNNTSENSSYFCRINEKKLISGINLQKGDIALIDGFLQTKKVFEEATGRVEGRISTIICQKIMILDNVDPSQEFYSLKKEIINIPVRKIDFSKPKPNELNN